jgi:hypothetical protein
LNLSILACCSRKDVTQSIKCFSIPRLTVWRILGMIIVVGEMHFIFQTTPSEVPTARSYRYCLSSHFSVSSPSVASILSWKYSQ